MTYVTVTLSLLLFVFRRLNTLNKCATMKIEAPPRKMVSTSANIDANPT